MVGKEMEEIKGDKIKRVLGIYTKLLHGEIIRKEEEAQAYGVNPRSISRDIADIRAFLQEERQRVGNANEVVDDRKKGGYYLRHTDSMQFTNSEVLAICKILLDSRAFTKKEMNQMLDKMIEHCVPEHNRKLVTELIRNEAFHYMELQHKSVFIDKMWEIAQAIHTNHYIEVHYTRTKDHAVVIRKLQPAAIMFSEFYFYLAAFIDDKALRKNFDVINDSFPTIYRMDRIKEFKVLEEQFHVPYRSRFEEGEFRKRIQFMYGGRLKKVVFRYLGNSIEAVLDKIPTAQILSEEDGVYTVSAEVFGEGINMWFRSQGENVEILKEM